jgi:hypothetical protein
VFTIPAFLWRVRATQFDRRCLSFLATCVTLVAEYRCYFLDDEGHIVARQEFEASDDVAALELARALYTQRSGPRYGFEVWAGSSFVHSEDESPPLSLD